MGLFSRKTTPPPLTGAPVDDALARRIGQLVNEDNVAEAIRLTDASPHPRDTAFAAFRYIDVTDPE